MAAESSTNNNIAEESFYSVANGNVKIVNIASQNGPDVPIVGLDKDGCILLYIGNVNKVFGNPAIRGKKVCIVSISGNFNEGKSFWLNAVATDLDAMCKSGVTMEQLCEQPSDQWIQRLMESETIFAFHGKRNAAAPTHTSGILITAEPFILHQADGSEVAVFLMDTQGQSDASKLASIVQQLSFFISSVQIVNMKEKMTDDCMSFLLGILERCKTTTAVNSTDNKQFQSTIFLIRDMAEDGPHACDLLGGKEFFDAQIGKWPQLRDDLDEMFDQPVRCALMAEPSKGIRQAKDKNDLRKMLANPSQMQENEPFICSYYALFAELFDGDKLLAKRINDEQCSAEQLGEHIKFYLGLIANGTLQEAKSLFELEQEARRQKEEACRREEAMRREHEEEMRRQEKEMRRKHEEETRRREEEMRRKAEKMRRKHEEETHRREEEMRREREEARRREEWMRREREATLRREEEMRREFQESMRRQEQERRRQDQELRRCEEEMRCKREEDRRRQQAETRRQQEEDKRRQEEEKRRREEVRRQEEECVIL